MQDALAKAARQLIPPNYVDAGIDGGLNPHERSLRSLLSQRRCPAAGLSDVAVLELMHRLSLMDSNNFPAHTGAGEREGRVLSRLVAQRHYFMSHGIGRSGNLTEAQPKAAGSSLIYQLTNAMVLDVLRHVCEFQACAACVVVPMATGMTLALVLRSVAHKRPPSAKYVVWPRIDQRTCLKCIAAAGLVPFPVALRRVADAEVTPSGQPSVFFRIEAADIAAAIEQLGPENVVCVLSTTSCFAPRIPDDPLPISRLCGQHGIPYVINNAYGLMSTQIMKRINSAAVHGRVDAVVQSTDKNFMVPVGGAVVAGDKDTVRAVCDGYAGRASASPIVDVFMTLLGCGRDGLKDILHSTRYRVLHYLRESLQRFAAEKCEQLLVSRDNDISFVLTMTSYGSSPGVPPGEPGASSDEQSSDIEARSPASTQNGSGGSASGSAASRVSTELGARLFRQCVSGPKVLTPGKAATLCGATFLHYGMHSDDQAAAPPLLVIACAPGMTTHEVDRLCATLRDLWR
jgi:O-phospho-L-seryl-tRNASec:L-selenocysteinyl-tRNA synthase